MTFTVPPAAHTERVPAPAVTVLLATIETLIGRRPLHGIRRRTTASAFADIVACVEFFTFRDLRAHSLTTQMPHARAVEATLTLDFGGRRLACAIRVERTCSRWMCSHAEVLGLQALAAQPRPPVLAA